MRGPDPLPVDGHHARLDGARPGRPAPASSRSCGDPQVGVESEGEQHPAHRVVQVGDPQAQQVLHVVGDGQVLAEGVEVPARQHPADLQREQRVAQVVS